MMPDQQSHSFIQNGSLVELNPDCVLPVKLYWHCWNLKSKLLEKLTRQLISGAKRLLED